MLFLSCKFQYVIDILLTVDWCFVVEALDACELKVYFNG